MTELNQVNQRPIIDKTISVCTKKDAEVWAIAHKEILRNISANRYTVVVPENEVIYFKLITEKPFEVISESFFSKSVQNLKARLPHNQLHQYGWYLQQIIKLAAIKEMNASEIALIWDADTIPTQPLNFLTSDNRIIYYQGREHHQPYFECIERLTGLKKIVDFSFIAQCFAIKVEWFNEFCNEIQFHSKVPWNEAILNQIDFNESNGFSEYETLGTYISHKYSAQIFYSKRPWHRLGHSLIGHPAFLDTYIRKNQPPGYDFISFEKWDRIKPYFFKVTIPYLIKVQIPQFFSKLRSRVRI